MKIKKLIVLILLLCITGCSFADNNSVNVNSEDELLSEVDPMQNPVDDEEKMDVSSFDNQLEVIVNQISTDTRNFMKFYTVADLDNNGRLELLSTYNWDLIWLSEVSDDISSVEHKGSLRMYINKAGEKPLKCYKLNNKFIYVGYDSWGVKDIYSKEDGEFSYSILYRREYPSRDLSFLDDGEGNYLLPVSEDYLIESKKTEDEYFANAEDKYFLYLNWYNAENGFDKSLLKEIYQKNTRKDYTDMDELEYVRAFTGCNCYLPDKQDLSDDTIALFESCAVYFPEGDYASDNLLSSMDSRELEDFFFCMQCDGIEKVHDYENDDEYNNHLKEIPTTLRKIPYDEWIYMMKEVYNESDAELIASKMPDKFKGEMDAYYSKTDNCIYLEMGTIGFSPDEAIVKKVEKTQDGYKITYIIYSGFGDGVLNTVDVYVTNDSNKYGYRLKKIEKEN